MCTDGVDNAAPLRGATSAHGTSGSSHLRRPKPAATAPFVVAIVGPAGSGKSTLARSLAGPRTRVLDADRFGHEITDGDAAVRAALAAEYGAGVYRADGTLDRARVGARVFSDPSALARLNALVHPRIAARLRDEIAHATGIDTLVIDAAVLLDWGFERECDAVIAVLASRGQQIARLRKARGWSEEEVTRRLASARSHEEFRALADEVVVNDQDEAVAGRAMRDAVERLRARWSAR